MKKKILAVVAGLAVAAGLALILFWDQIGLLVEGPRTVEPYSVFYSLVEEGTIESCKIGEKEIVYTKKGDAREYGWKTENPSSPTLKEKLLLSGAGVTEEQDGMETFNFIMDIVFYVIFFGVILVVFRKFISPNTFKVVRNTGKKFSDVVGMDSLKRDMVQVMDMMNHPAEWAKKGMRMPKGILLEGAPGNGKTLFAKALAGEAKVNFIPTKATDFESMFMAIGPMKVKLLFKKARRKAPCIVFIDEFDGIGTKRNYSGSAIETENTRIVTALLNELDGFEPTSGVLVLAATNSISALDEALIRPGRFDAKFSVPFPDEQARVQIVRMYQKGSQWTGSPSAEVLAAKFKGFSCAKIESVLNRASLICTQRNDETVEMSYIDEAMAELKEAR